MELFKDFKDDLVKQVAAQMPVGAVAYDIGGKRTGLIIVDEIVGFCTVGAGPLAPAVPNPQVDRMIAATNALARRLVDAGMPVLAFRDVHVKGRPEDPYPEHCIAGTGHEELVPELRWLHDENLATVMDKDVINGVLGGIRADGGNTVFDWIKDNNLETILLAGICTDVCLLDGVCALLSARNHWVAGKPMLGALKDIVVVEQGSATYDLPVAVARQIGLPETSAHPQEMAHYVGLWVMQARGAIIASTIA